MPVLGLIAVLAAGLAGCTADGPPPSVCVPELDVRPAVAHPGDTVTVSARRACPVDPPETLHLRAQPGESASHIMDVSADPAADGSFEIELTLPPDMPNGRAIVFIRNWWDVVECPGTASCASAEGSFTVSGG